VTPTARSLKLLRDAGYIAAVVEAWLPYAGVRRDAFGFGDVLAAHPGAQSILLVQATTLDHVGARLTKARARAELAVWLAAGGAFEVHGWGRRGRRWHCKRVAVQNADGTTSTIHDNPAERTDERGTGD
jgi:hypothetical protein